MPQQKPVVISDAQASFKTAMSVIRATGTRFKGEGFQKVRDVGFANPASIEARKPVKTEKAWDSRYFEVLKSHLGSVTAAKLIHRGVVHQ